MDQPDVAGVCEFEGLAAHGFSACADELDCLVGVRVVVVGLSGDEVGNAVEVDANIALLGVLYEVGGLACGWWAGDDAQHSSPPWIRVRP